MGGESGGHPSLFLLARHPDAAKLSSFTLCFGVLLALTVFLEVILEKARHRLGAGPRYYRLIFDQLMKELMLLGVLSFSIFIGEQALQLYSASFYIELEFAHVLIFFVGLALLSNTCIFTMSLAMFHTNKLAKRCRLDEYESIQDKPAQGMALRNAAKRIQHILRPVVLMRGGTDMRALSDVTTRTAAAVRF